MAIFFGRMHLQTGGEAYKIPCQIALVTQRGRKKTVHFTRLRFRLTHVPRPENSMKIPGPGFLKKSLGARLSQTFFRF